MSSISTAHGYRLQRSRALSSAEMPRQMVEWWQRHKASTEPRSFERGDSKKMNSRARGRLSFNGAALFRARRCAFVGMDWRAEMLLQRSRALSSAEIARALPGAGQPILASTEPRSFERGDKSGELIAIVALRASTEPRSFERGDSVSVADDGSALKLQRSRALSSAEIEEESEEGPAEEKASTEPRSFERGDL